MFSFRKKIVFTYLVTFLILFAVLFPFISKSAESLLKHGLLNISEALLDKTKKAKNIKEFIQTLRQEEFSIVFRASLINAGGQVLYDSHVERLFGHKVNPYKATKHPEVKEALKKGVGYSESYSRLFNENFIYLAKAFSFKGQTFVLRMAFPTKQVQGLAHTLEVGFFLLTVAALLLFSTLTLLILQRITKPIHKIIKAVKSYRPGQQNSLPLVNLGKRSQHDDFQKLAGTINSLSDQIQRKVNAITNEKDEKSSVLETLDEGVISTDENLTITYANFVALQIFNLKKEDVENQNLVQLIQKLPKNIAEALKMLVDKATTLSKAVNQTLQVEKARFIDLVATPKKKNKGFVVVVQDKTLHNQVIEMGKQFVANASHELKTPITIIRGFAETLHDNPQLDEKLTTEITSKIVKNCERMSRLIKTLMKLSEIENLPRERFILFDLLGIVKKAERSISSLSKEVDFQYKLDKGFYRVKGDPGLIELALYNLFENAVKYSRKKTVIRLELSIHEKKTVLKVCDNGIGIPKEDLQHIYQRFFNVDKSKSKKLGGVGLGLSIVKTVIDQHGAKINVISKLSKGTAFTITFPEVH